MILLAYANCLIFAYTFGKLSPSPSEAGLSKLYNHSGTTTAKPPPPPPNATARASESKLLDFVGS